MRYILVEIEYDSGCSGILIVSYDPNTCETKQLFHSAEYEEPPPAPIFDILEINSGLISYSSVFKSSFEDLINVIEDCCRQRFFASNYVSYIVKEIPKSKVFELML